MDEGPNFDPIVLFTGYCKSEGANSLAGCTSVLLKGPPTIIIDTLSSWDGPKLQLVIEKHDINCSDINYVICTHGHSDHIGCNYLFPNAKQIVGYDICFKNTYYPHDFGSGKEYIINDNIKVIPTPGHTLQDVTVLVTSNGKTYAITGDLFENEDDLHDDNIWISAGSQSEELQRSNRKRILQIADYIVPGHGAMFEVPSHYKSPN